MTEPSSLIRTVLGMAMLLALSARVPALATEPMGCEAAAARAEQESGLPAGLLAAIGQVESGRRAAEGGTQIWPWTVNAQGQGRFLARPDDAISYVSALLSQGVRSIDVGCFQVNLAWHPDAFTSLAEAFDPLANARYAAQFLLGLRRDSGDWGSAIARYHSAIDQYGIPYRSLVFAAWSGSPARPQPPSAHGGDPVVIRMTPEAQRIHVFYGAITMPPSR
jgi:hypothetical protein